ncbi:hypothetical protein [Yersinia mollaretii]|uniref:hypothetical protein n=1 Tax=Yersinia mollaretii TaxID=33060 RepID=UPI0011A29B3B|nr:hypothetical protein [Yersinia mollaretii]
MSVNNGGQVTPPLVLDLGVKQEGVFNDVEMGILENGIPYLTQSGLARICGVNRSNIADIANDYAECFRNGVFPNGRMQFISSYLQQAGYTDPALYISVNRNGSIHYAFPDIVCMALLEFYAFVSNNTSNATAQQYFRDLARVGFRDYVYLALRYQPEDPWKPYRDRVSIIHSSGSVPDGYFIIFNEIAGLMVDLIQAGLIVNMYTVPDISVGSCWGRHWNSSGLAGSFGNRVSCEHNYPDDFNQSGSNPQQINAYPNSALAEFRRWFKHEYLPTKFPSYILKKAGMLAGGQVAALQIANNFRNGLPSRS